jgi:hypothetical protein
MRTSRYFSALACLAVIFAFAGGDTASAQRLNYSTQTTGSVTVDYYNLPASTQIFILNQITGAKWAALVPLLSGSGSLAVPVPTGPGQYNLLAEQAGVWVAVTVMFYTD